MTVLNGFIVSDMQASIVSKRQEGCDWEMLNAVLMRTCAINVTDDEWKSSSDRHILSRNVFQQSIYLSIYLNLSSFTVKIFLSISHFFSGREYSRWEMEKGMPFVIQSLLIMQQQGAFRQIKAEQ